MTRRGKTQKRRSSKKTLSIPELRSSMEHMTSFSQKLVHSKISTKEAAKQFASEWKKVFGKTLAPKVAEDYIKHSMRGKRHTRKHRGGGPIAGAPIDYMTRPGANLPYGNFQQYVNSGFVTPQPGVLTDAGVRQGVTPQYGMGSNKMAGGGIFDSISTGVNAILNRPFVAENPVTTQQSGMIAWKGMPPSPGGASYDQNWRYISDASKHSFPPASIYTRTLSQQGQIA